MKTAVVMNRVLLGNDVRQNSQTKMFNANDMHKVGNEHRENNGLSTKQLASYFNLESTEELINAICLEENISFDDVKKSKRGKDGGTWVHPVLFVDLAMWYSPQLRVKIINWVLDGLLEARNESGESFKKMMSSLTKYFSDEINNPLAYTKIANQIANACQVGTDKDKWQKASEDQLKLRDKIQENVCLLADVTPNVGTCLNKSIEKALDHLRLKSEELIK